MYINSETFKFKYMYNLWDDARKSDKEFFDEFNVLKMKKLYNLW